MIQRRNIIVSNKKKARETDIIRELNIYNTLHDTAKVLSAAKIQVRKKTLIRQRYNGIRDCACGK
jgi:hypothetical protein